MYESRLRVELRKGTRVEMSKYTFFGKNDRGWRNVAVIFVLGGTSRRKSTDHVESVQCGCVINSVYLLPKLRVLECIRESSVDEKEQPEKK